MKRASDRIVRVVGADDVNLKRLRTLERYREYEFKPLFTEAEVKGDVDRPLPELAQIALERLRDEPPAGVIAYWDFPANGLAHYVRGLLGLPGPTLESVLRCSHKYWARTTEVTVSPECVPSFEPLDPFETDAISEVSLELPFWIKPVKATGSALSFHVTTAAEARDALRVIRADISTFARSFNHLLSVARVPPWVRRVDGYHCIVESPLTGVQCTVSGFVHDGQVVMLGIVDSNTYPDTSAFRSFVYPSRLDEATQQELLRRADQMIRPFGLNESGFNIEFFVDGDSGQLGLLEVNPRFSQSHAELYSRVDGTSNHQLLVDLATGNDPHVRRREGRYQVAAKFFLRVFCDVLITSVPDARTLDRIRRTYDCEIVLFAGAGDRLTHVATEDVHCHDVAQVYLGASDYREAERTYETIVREMNIGIEELS
ncbi:MAG: ATP-grasp domain-containing protein [Spirochaetota bacterium]